MLGSVVRHKVIGSNGTVEYSSLVIPNTHRINAMVMNQIL
jgi:hypothetical protein